MFSLQQRHSFALPTHTHQLIEIRHPSELDTIEYGDGTWLLGEGSNTIFTEDYRGQVLVNKLMGVVIHETSDAWQLEVAAGENWHALVTQLNAKNIPGFENLALIPGSVGAAPVQNIGAYGVEVADFIEQVDVYDFKRRCFFSLDNAGCEFAYRDSIFKRNEHAHWFIVAVHFRLPKQWQANLSYPDLATLPADVSASAVMNKVIAVRQAKLPDPSVLANAGSFFKNPVVSVKHFNQLVHEFGEMPAFPLSKSTVKLAAGWLIDKAGLKGLRVGDIGVHDRQALVLVNHGSGTGAELKQLALEIMQQVHTRYKIQLEPEVRVLAANGLVQWQ